MTHIPEDKQPSFAAYLWQKVSNVGSVAGSAAIGWFTGRGASKITGIEGVEMHFFKRNGVDFVERWVEPMRNGGGKVRLSMIGGIVGTAVGGLYQGYKGWTRSHKQSATLSEMHNTLHQTHAMTERNHATIHTLEEVEHIEANPVIAAGEHVQHSTVSDTSEELSV